MTPGSFDLNRHRAGSPPAGRSKFGWLKQAPWLTTGRARSYLAILAAASGLSLALLVGAGLWQSSTDRTGRPVAIDYAAFWGAGRLALQHEPDLAYSRAAIYAAELEGSRLPPGKLYPFLYPPAFLLIFLPLALLPYLPSLWLMVGVTAGLLIATLRRIAPTQCSWLAVAAFPGFLLNAGNGQAGCLFAACFGAACLLLERFPAVAGMCLGILVCKPHLAICVPVGLVAARRWRALAACAATACCLAAASWLTFGIATWAAFLASMSGSAAALLDAQALGRMQSAFAACLLLHGRLQTATAIQVAATLLSLAMLVRVTGKRPGGRTEISAIVLVTMAATPYLFDYDLVCLAVPLAWWASRVGQTGFLDWEKSALAAGYILPLLARSSGVQLGIPLTPAIIFSLIILLHLRARHDARSLRDAPLSGSASQNLVLSPA